ncbi:HAD family hydrolase [Rossellomorea vietnamensis]|nr:HAD family hydrolase [Rossellomorea vietnamensis]
MMAEERTIKAIIFDLDGTLYEDTHHFDFYAERLKVRTAVEYQGNFEDDYQKIIKGSHPLRIGRVYDVSRDLILIHKNGEVSEALTWEGEQLDEEGIRDLYREKLTFDMDTMFNVGDLWWVPNSIGRHYGLTSGESAEAFMETRTFMAAPDYQLNAIESLIEVLDNLKERVLLVLLTNSPEEDSEIILEKLGMKDSFHLKVFNGNKPLRTKEQFEAIKEKTCVEFHEMLSVGDNLINEILPAKELGCATVLIDPHEISVAGDADDIVRNIEEVVPVLSGLLFRERMVK